MNNDTNPYTTNERKVLLYISLLISSYIFWLNSHQGANTYTTKSWQQLL